MLSSSLLAGERCDTTAVAADTVSTTKRPSLFDRVVNYFSEANVPRDDGKLDISFIGGPHYSSDVGFGIGLVASGVYGMPLIDSVTMARKQSEAAVYVDVSTSGYAEIGVRGTQIFSGDNIRQTYNVSFSHYPRKYWGIGYDAGCHNNDYTKYTQLDARLATELSFRIRGSFFIGPTLDFAWIAARKVTERERWAGQRLAVPSLGVGVMLIYDTRDNITAPHRGVYASLEQAFFPRFLANGNSSFSRTTAFIAHYRPLWRGSTLAMRLHGEFTYGHTPWTMMPTFGGSRTMRGYYEGQYNDKAEMDATVELRQNVWGRSGVVVWGSAATVFPRLSAIRISRVLPNFGIGYRWEFKKNSNVRVDIGFGRGQSGFVFNINEAF